MTRNHTLGQALVDIGNVMSVHHLPDPITVFPRYRYPGVCVHVRQDHLPAWISALRAVDRDPEQRDNGLIRISAAATLASGGAIEVYAYEASNDDTDN